MTEVEAKFLVRHRDQVADVIRILEDLDFGVRKEQARSQVDTYFDTSDWAILRSGWAYRCRQTGGASSLTLKSAGRQEGAVFFRDEIVQPLPDDDPQPGGELPAGPVRERLAPIIGSAKKRKLFSIKTRRAIYIAERSGENAASVELDIDECRIRARKARDDAAGRLEFMELEIELLDGETDVVAEIAAALRSGPDLVPAQLSKFERGLHTAGLSADSAGADPGVTRHKAKDPVAGLLYDYLRSQYAVLVTQQPVAWEGLDPEGVHKMRVATRRMRALLRCFAVLLPTEPAASLEAELKWLARHLGDARDADVCERQIALLGDVLPPDVIESAEPYIEHLRSTTAGAYSNMARIFAGERYRALMTGLGAFVTNGPDAPTLEKLGNLTVASCASFLVADVAGKVLRRGDRIDNDSGARKLHKLRIIAKRLRYLLEFFATVQTRKWRKPVIALQELHDILGDHQDAMTAKATLAAFTESLPTGSASRELLLVVGRLMQHEDERCSDCRARFPAAWQRFRATLV